VFAPKASLLQGLLVSIVETTMEIIIHLQTYAQLTLPLQMEDAAVIKDTHKVPMAALQRQQSAQLVRNLP
jgi:hypothetical protein